MVGGFRGACFEQNNVTSPTTVRLIKAGILHGALRVRFTPSTLCEAYRAAFFAGRGGFGRQNKLPHKGGRARCTALWTGRRRGYFA